MKVKVLRAFCVRGVRQDPGAELEIADSLARELIHFGKAERVAADAPAAAGRKAPPVKPPPMTAAGNPGLVPGSQAQLSET